MTYEQRYVIEGMLKNGHKKIEIAIAASIGQALSRELKRNSGRRVCAS